MAHERGADSRVPQFLALQIDYRSKSLDFLDEVTRLVQRHIVGGQSSIVAAVGLVEFGFRANLLIHERSYAFIPLASLRKIRLRSPDFRGLPDILDPVLLISQSQPLQRLS